MFHHFLTNYRNKIKIFQSHFARALPELRAFQIREVYFVFFLSCILFRLLISMTRSWHCVRRAHWGLEAWRVLKNFTLCNCVIMGN